MAEERKVKAVLNIGGEIGSSLKGAFNALTGNIGKIGTVANKAITKQLGQAINDAKKNARDLNAEIKRTGDVTGSLARQLEAVNKRLTEAKGANELYHSLGSAAGKFAVGLAAVSAEATATGWAIYHMTEKYEEYLKMARVGGKTNDMTPQNFARLNYATGGGDNMEAVMKARGMFAKGSATGSKQFMAALKQIGLSASDLKGLSLTDAFFKTGDALKNFKGDRVALSKILMGRGGQAALPFLMRGSDVNRQRMKEADDLNLVPKQKAIEQSAEYAHTMQKLQGAILGVKLALGESLLPVMERVGETMSEFWTEHKDEFQRWASQLGKTIEENLPTMAQLEKAFHILGSSIDYAANHTWIIKGALGTLITMPFLPFIASLLTITVRMKELGAVTMLTGLGSAAKGLWGIAAANAPLLVMVGTIATLTAGIVSLGAAIKHIHDNWDTWGDSASWKGLLKNMTGGAPSNDPQKIKEEVEAMRNSKHAAKPSPLPAPSSTQNNHVTINVHASPGMDIHALAKAVATTFEGRLAAAGAGALYDA